MENRRDQIFPVLSQDQIATARRFASAPPRRFDPDAMMASVGQKGVPAYLILDGQIEIHRRGAGGQQGIVTIHGAGHITGEVSQLAGRAALVDVKAGPQGCEVLSFCPAHLRALIVGSAEIGEMVMRAFILRRVSLIEEGVGTVLLGAHNDPALLRIESFMAQNGHPYSTVDAYRGEEGREMIERLGLADEDLPLLLCANGSVLKRPTIAEVGACLGVIPELRPDKLYDVAVIGAGPAGLATAVYAASEGLSVLVLDERGFGGQAGASSRIENYLGFPTGISGRALAGRAFTQAQKFGAEVAIPVSVERLDCGGGEGQPLILSVSGDKKIRARTVVIASGARYRKLPVANLELFEGGGVSYWASPVEAKLCAGAEIALVGAGNSAGQAVVFLAPKVRTLHLIVRGPSLEASMSRYLIDRIAQLPNVVTHFHAEVASLQGDAAKGLEGLEIRDKVTGAVSAEPIRHLFLFIGAEPNAHWLDGCPVALDPHGFILTGDAAGRSLSLETSIPGVFAIGDVRSGSTKRVAAAVGEGAQVVSALHGLLA